MALNIVFPGPEFEFARQSGGLVNLVLLGDENLVRESFKMLSDETRSFRNQVDELGPKAVDAYLEFSEMGQLARPATKAEINGLLSKVNEPAKSKLAKYFNEVNGVMALIDARNTKFLDQTIASKQDTVLVIGKYHVPGLRKELAARCLQMPGPKRTSAAEFSGE